MKERSHFCQDFFKLFRNRITEIHYLRIYNVMIKLGISWDPQFGMFPMKTSQTASRLTFAHGTILYFIFNKEMTSKILKEQKVSYCFCTAYNFAWLWSFWKPLHTAMQVSKTMQIISRFAYHLVFIYVRTFLAEYFRQAFLSQLFTYIFYYITNHKNYELCAKINFKKHIYIQHYLYFVSSIRN